MERRNMAAARRLDSLKMAAQQSVATILKNWPEGEARDRYVAARTDWRKHRYPKARSGGAWGKDGAYHVDTFDVLGWREVGTAHEVTKRDGYIRNAAPTGWYCDGDQSETIGGHVLQIPARDGVAQYVAGVSWTNSDGVTVWPRDRYETAMEAARAADCHAERLAEQSREYWEAWSRAQRWRDLETEATEERHAARALIRDIRTVRRSPVARGVIPPTICDALRSTVRDHLTTWQRLLAERQSIDDGFSYWADDGRRLSVAEFAAENL